MQRRAIGLIVFCGVLAFGIRPAAADPIRLTGGSLDIGTTGALLLQGTRGFTLSGSVSAIDGVFLPWLQCSLSSSCMPGAEIDFGAYWVGSSLRSTTVTLEGHTFTNVGGLISDSSASVRFIGSGIAPPLDRDTASVVAPFEFRGEFSYLNASFERVEESFLGAGMVTVMLRRNPAVPTWGYTSARYEFHPAPEPATVVLTALGAAGLAARRMRRRRLG